MSTITVFVALNWLLSLATSVLIVRTFLRQRFLFVKPSVVVIVFFHAFIQWGATVKSYEIEFFLPDPLQFAFLVHGFAIIGLIGSWFILTAQSRRIWQRLINQQQRLAYLQRRAIWMLSGVIGIITLWYLSTVPLLETGLYAVFFDPQMSSIARENSLKFVTSPLLRYIYSFTASALAPLLSVLIGLRLANNFKYRRIIWLVIDIAILCAILAIVSLTGIRSYAASMLMALFLAYLLSRKLKVSWVHVLFITVGTLSVPVLITILREGHELDLFRVIEYYHLLITERLIIGPMKIGLYHVHYAQTIGTFGIAGVPKLADLLGEISVNVPNLIGLIYVHSTFDSVNADASFVFSYYSYFGLVSFPISVFCLWVTDIAILFYERISDLMLMPCVVAASVASVSFVQSDFTTVLLTHGFGVVLVISYLIDKVLSLKIKTGSSQYFREQK